VDKGTRVNAISGRNGFTSQRGLRWLYWFQILGSGFAVPS